VQENALGQKFKVDVTLYCGHQGLRSAGRSDSLEETESYAECYRHDHDLESVADKVIVSRQFSIALRNGCRRSVVHVAA
jgi:hypothetical protein